MRWTIVTIMTVSIWAEAQSVDYRTSSQQLSTGDLLQACYADPARDLTCEQIVEMNDFGRRLIDQAIDATGLREYQDVLGVVVGIAASRKATARVFDKGPEVDLTHNLDSQVTSLNWSFGF